MPDVHALPAPIVPQDWGNVDTSIDGEAPEWLSESQFDRYTETVRNLLATAGLEVEDPDPRDPAHIEASSPHSGFKAEIDIHEDRTAEWIITGFDETPEGTRALALASLIVRLLNVETDV
ncbi:hypothetical protein GCM10009799_10220 [Nocardiopsis rhodophaea]|uniref:Uncharacterized protein n=1 Tax=Nocardiopsis rhodophaea TaxID=280238 RepID=A0ABN2SH55_9ACTN